MVYIYDILLNFTDTDKIYEFFEWSFNDSIEHIKKIPLWKVEEKELDDFFRYTIKLDEQDLLKLQNNTEVFDQKKVQVLNYAVLFTDGKRALAMEFDTNGISLYKSRLLLDEEEEVLEIAERMDLDIVNYQKTKKGKESFYFTRNEEVIKKYLLKEIRNAYQNSNHNKIAYLYSECFAKESDNYETMYSELLNSIEEQLKPVHLQLYQLLKMVHIKKQV